MNNIKLMKWTFVTLYVLVSFVSINHLFHFLSIVDSDNMAIVLSVGYALGTAASIWSLSIADKMKQNLIISLFVLLTIMEVLGNVYFAFSNLDIEKVKTFSELFGITNYTAIAQKRMFSMLFGIPIVLISMGYIKVLINYLNSVTVEEKLEGMDKIWVADQDETEWIDEKISEDGIRTYTNAAKDKMKFIIPTSGISAKQAEGKVKEMLTKYKEEIVLNEEGEIPTLKAVKNIFLGQTGESPVIEPITEEDKTTDNYKYFQDKLKRSTMVPKEYFVNEEEKFSKYIDNIKKGKEEKIELPISSEDEEKPSLENIEPKTTIPEPTQNISRGDDIVR